MSEESKKSANTETEKVYERLRAQVVDENELYNQRIHWLIFIEALLFATTGLVLEVFFTSQIEDYKSFITAFILIVGLLGIYTALVCYRTLNSARNALNEIKDLWDRYVETLGVTHEEVNWYPHVGGGKPIVQQGVKGRHDPVFRSKYLPLGFVFAWSAILALVFIYITS